MKKGTLTEKDLDKMLEIALKYEKEHPMKWYWRFTWRFPFIKRYTLIDVWK
jgi:hypothetical protein